MQDTPFNHYMFFLTGFIVIYIPLAVIIGFFDFRKGTYRAEQELSKELSPIWKEVFREFREMREENKLLQEKVDNLSHELGRRYEKS